MVKNVTHPQRSAECLRGDLRPFWEKGWFTRPTSLRRVAKTDAAGSLRLPGGEQRPDPVSLAIFAIDRIGPAAVRACASGVEVSVAAPDEATAAVLSRRVGRDRRAGAIG